MKIRNICIASLCLVAVLNPLKAQNMEPKPSEKVEFNRRTLFADSELKTTDPEFIEVFDNFAWEMNEYGGLDKKTRLMAILASTIARNSLSVYKIALANGLDVGITPVEAKEILYQAVPYVGMSGVLDFIDVTNMILTERGIILPLSRDSTVSAQTRFDRGIAAQKEIFGAENIDNLYRNAPENQKHIQIFLSENCFGDYVSREGIDLKTREMLTFSMLLSLGDCEPQLKSHIRGNVNLGNDKDFLLAVATQLIPYAGYPRVLNAIACLNEVIPE